MRPSPKRSGFMRVSFMGLGLARLGLTRLGLTRLGLMRLGLRSRRAPGFALAGLSMGLLAASPAGATPAVVMDMASGDVLYQQDATQPWYPASTTKLMTVYVALSAVRDGRIAMDTPLVVSARAHVMPPSKMGFAVGSQVTLDNALKMLMVRSANDLAVTVAEGVSGSVEAFADDMNAAAAQLGLHESHFVNPNGLPAAGHVSSARDMAMIARALYTQFPDQAGLFDLGALSLGRQVIVNHNNLLGRYPGVDGMKTGFTCAAGFNVVASAFRDGRRIIAVVYGAPNVATRTAKTAALLDRAFAGVDHTIGSIVALPTAASDQPPDMRKQVCRARSNLVAQFNREVEQLDAPLTQPVPAGTGSSLLHPELGSLFAARPTTPVQPMATRINFLPTPIYTPSPVFVGAAPGYAGPVAEARAAHTPIGTQTPPATAEAYAPAEQGGQGQPGQAIGGTPLAVDANALPLHGRRRAARRARQPRAVAQAPAPATEAVEGAEAAKADGKADAKPEGKAPGKARGKAIAKAAHGKRGAKLVAAVKPADEDEGEGHPKAAKEASKQGSSKKEAGKKEHGKGRAATKGSAKGKTARAGKEESKEEGSKDEGSKDERSKKAEE